MRLFARLASLFEGVLIAIDSIRQNRVRAALTILGSAANARAPAQVDGAAAAAAALERRSGSFRAPGGSAERLRSAEILMELVTVSPAHERVSERWLQRNSPP